MRNLHEFAGIRLKTWLLVVPLFIFGIGLVPTTGVYQQISYSANYSNLDTNLNTKDRSEKVVVSYYNGYYMAEESAILPWGKTVLISRWQTNADSYLNIHVNQSDQQPSLCMIRSSQVRATTMMFGLITLWSENVPIRVFSVAGNPIQAVEVITPDIMC